MYAGVVVDTGGSSPVEFLTYEIPDGLEGKLGVGACVLVPLGKRQAVGYVIAFHRESPVANTRPIISDLESPIRLTPDMLRLAEWVAEQYICPLPRVIAGMLPGVMHCRIQARVSAQVPAPDSPVLTPSEAALLSRIEQSGGQADVDSLVDGSRDSTLRILRQLETKGRVRRAWELVQPSGKPRLMRGVRLLRQPSSEEKLPAKQAEAVDVLARLGRDVTLIEITRRHSISRSALSSLERKGLVAMVEMSVRRAPAFTRVQQSRVQLTDDQQRAVLEISSAIEARCYRGYLLFGVTASGKTEVYLRCIERALSLGRTSLVLLPEIALTTQVMNIFKSRFGDQVAVLHSALSAGERCDEWTRISDGEAKVVLGARSAVFAPLEDLGLVIVDEEHEASYKQDTQPRYNGRDTAIWRAKDAGAALVLGSATPSVETFHRCEKGEFTLLKMPSRIGGRSLPAVHVADLREDWAQGRVTIFSKRLEEAVRDRLARKQQVMLLQNRRAYSTFLLCRDCGFVPHCPNCAVSLKLHSAQRKLSCHHCDYSRAAPTVCPKCEGRRLRGFGIGTERVEEETRKTFPEARVLRMDRDTTARKGSHGAILDAFRHGEADILVGTQMIAKGLDFPNVTLVGVISADTSLNLPDFRASERTFQLISQVAGRSGRGVEPGEVVIQTFDPENYAIQRAVAHDYEGFCAQELEMRADPCYPPFATLVNVISRDEDERTAQSRLEKLVEAIRREPMSDRRGIELIGPQRAVLAKLRGEYRWHLVMRSRERNMVLRLVRVVLDGNQTLKRQLVVDVDPASML